MDDTAVSGLLETLARRDAEAWFAYGGAIDEVDATRMRRRLMAFRREHRRQFDDLADEMRRLGATPPDFARGATARDSAGGLAVIGALEAAARQGCEAALERRLPP